MNPSTERSIFSTGINGVPRRTKMTYRLAPHDLDCIVAFYRSINVTEELNPIPTDEVELLNIEGGISFGSGVLEPTVVNLNVTETDDDDREHQYSKCDHDPILKETGSAGILHTPGPAATATTSVGVRPKNTNTTPFYDSRLIQLALSSVSESDDDNQSSFLDFPALSATYHENSTVDNFWFSNPSSWDASDLETVDSWFISTDTPSEELHYDSQVNVVPSPQPSYRPELYYNINSSSQPTAGTSSSSTTMAAADNKNLSRVENSIASHSNHEDRLVIDSMTLMQLSRSAGSDRRMDPYFQPAAGSSSSSSSTTNTTMAADNNLILAQTIHTRAEKSIAANSNHEDRLVIGSMMTQSSRSASADSRIVPEPQPYSQPGKLNPQGNVVMVDPGDDENDEQTDLDAEETEYDEDLLDVEKDAGLTEEEIMENLVRRYYRAPTTTSRSSEDAELCVICWVEFKNRDVLGRINCTHKYHFECIKNWLMEKNSCPLCEQTAILLPD